MPDRTVLARRDGDDAPPQTPSFAALLRRLGADVVATATQSRAEHGRYGVGPGLVERVCERCRDGDADAVVVDGHLHEGQVVDLRDVLPVETVWDRRDAVWTALAADGNDVAEARRRLRTTRVTRRRVAAARRTAATDGPDDGGRLADLDRRCDRHEAALAEAQTTVRRAAADAYDDVDADVAVVGPADAPTTSVWAALCGRPAAAAPTAPFAPATVTTAVARVGAHETAVSDGPGLFDGDAAWYDAVVPGWTAAVERADVLVAVADGTRAGAVVREACARTDAPVVAVAPGTKGNAPSKRVAATVSADDGVPATDRLRAAVDDVLPTARLVVRLPYDDDAHALVSWLHDRGVVADVEYDDRITVRVAVPTAATARVRSRVTSVGGAVTERPAGASS